MSTVAETQGPWHALDAELGRCIVNGDLDICMHPHQVVESLRGGLTADRRAVVPTETGPQPANPVICRQSRYDSTVRMSVSGDHYKLEATARFVRRSLGFYARRTFVLGATCTSFACAAQQNSDLQALADSAFAGRTPSCFTPDLITLTPGETLESKLCTAGSADDTLLIVGYRVDGSVGSVTRLWRARVSAREEIGELVNVLIARFGNYEQCRDTTVPGLPEQYLWNTHDRAVSLDAHSPGGFLRLGIALDSITCLNR